jgi:BirA family transcriptional regulator, biotin operon repressor / biotin---[acetyl-CoA-carboxylase] ligase
VQEPAAEGVPPDFRAALERARSRVGPFGADVRFFSSTESTNTIACRLAASGAREGTVVVADRQTAGRGRLGREWFSPPASGLYVSVVLTPNRARVDPGRATTLLTISAGVALAEAIEGATGLRVEIKWPNDLIVAGRKLAGILAEASGPENHGSSIAIPASVVLGYGINVGPMVFPPELTNRAGTLESELGRPVDRPVLCAESLAALYRRYVDLLDGRFDAILDAWRARAPSSRGATVSWSTSGGPATGVTVGIDDRGALLVQSGRRVERIVAGELTWLSAGSAP